MKQALIQFFQDQNGHFCQRTLVALVFALFLLILCLVTVIYGLGHTVQSSTVVVEIIWGMITLVAGTLGLSTFMRRIGGNNSNNGDKPNE